MKKGILLLSGGFDSVVAGHQMINQGLSLIGIHCSLEPIVNDTSTIKAQQLAHHLSLTLIILNIGKQLAAINQYSDPRYYFVLQKRFMIRLAEHIAKENKGECIVTGENLGQVSSQTLHHLMAITHGAKLPILRPLLCWDKQEIIDKAKQIGTYSTSEGPEMCDILGPKHPVTKASIKQVLAQELKFNIEQYVKDVLFTARAIAK